MAKAKSVANDKPETVETAASVNADGTPSELNQAVNSAEGVTPKKDKAKAATAYEVVSLPSQRDRLSPQLRALVDAIDENTEEVNGKKTIFRARLFAKWSEKIGSESGDKVFASYMHQMLSFAFLDRIGGTTVAKKVISPAERKAKLMDMLAKLPEADRKELLASLAS